MTYPKAGTSWIQEVAWLVNHDACISPHTCPIWQVAWLVNHDADVARSDALTSTQRTVFIELSSPRVDKLALLSAAPGARHLKWHHSAELLPASVVEGGRVIYLLRNPKDTAVSWYHMQRTQKMFGFTGTFDQFFELFLRGNVAYGSYMHHLRSWCAPFLPSSPRPPLPPPLLLSIPTLYRFRARPAARPRRRSAPHRWALRDRPNVLLLSYEQVRPPRNHHLTTT